MKSFIFSVILIVLVLITSYIYSCYLCKLIDEMIALANTLPQNDEEFTTVHQNTINELKNKFQKHDTFFHLFIDDRHHTAIELALMRLDDYKATNNYSDFLYAKSNLISSLQDIKLIEGRSFFSIF